MDAVAGDERNECVRTSVSECVPEGKYIDRFGSVDYGVRRKGKRVGGEKIEEIFK
ncbi:hypothetical protein X777_01592 [Ooceraea biroi]|uniref:Uncharacterized protein n=1 Tax=Ooceraea biroi TaxID=2015173 RepID=A0A026WT02_OOCBI|nr:hypothetical protein X777_01592 [Ooceraea biroi]